MTTKIPSTAANKQWQNRLRTMTEDQVESLRLKKVLEILNTVNKEETGKKVLVFSKFLKTLDLLKTAVQMKKATHLAIFGYDGTVRSKQRPDTVKAYANQGTPEGTAVPLITHGCGPYGLKLAMACHTITIEPRWRRSDEDQAWARAHRQGQTEKVIIHHVFSIDYLVDKFMVPSAAKKADWITDIEQSLVCKDNEMPDILEQVPGCGSGDDNSGDDHATPVKGPLNAT
jgi:hypothetical protein